MSSSSASEPLDVALLKSWDFAGWRDRSIDHRQLPYRMDYLEDHGLRLRWTDALHTDNWAQSGLGRVVRRAEGLAVPFAQTLAMARPILDSPITLAMFESEANFLAVTRRAVPGRRSSILAVVTCWLTQVLRLAGPRRLAAYRWAYQSVDRLYYLSQNQGPVLAELLDIDPRRLHLLPFGVDAETFRPTTGEEADYLLVVGRDKGRDWPTLLKAVDGIGLPVKICCRVEDLAGAELPPGIEVLGYVDRSRYMSLLSRARVVAVSIRTTEYPSGQSVMLEAMAMARAVVVTNTASLSEYISDGKTALAVPPGDPDALRARILEAASDEDLRRRIGAAGRAAVEETFNARAMWSTVADDLRELLHRHA